VLLWGTPLKLAPVRHWEDVRQAVRLLAVSVCPKVADHPGVEQWLSSNGPQSLASELLPDAIKEEQAALSGDGREQRAAKPAGTPTEQQ
jgi:hypothetical protein